MRAMKIPNRAVGALAVSFAILGLIALPLEVWAWRWLHLVIALGVGIVANAMRAMGAGDAKFIAAAAPFVALQDLPVVIYILSGVTLAAVLVHRIAKNTRIRNLAPDWESWITGKRFPMGLPLGMTLVIYLLMPFLIG